MLWLAPDVLIMTYELIGKVFSEVTGFRVYEYGFRFYEYGIRMCDK